MMNQTSADKELKVKASEACQVSVDYNVQSIIETDTVRVQHENLEY